MDRRRHQEMMLSTVDQPHAMEVHDPFGDRIRFAERRH
jgi:hypothetical protein